MIWILILLLGCSLTETTLGWTYHHSPGTMSWYSARDYCRKSYTDMVVIQNQEENDYLVSMLPNRNKAPYYWIGITKKHLNETWTWIGNNSTWIGEHSWAANEPNNNHSTEFCVEIYVNRGPNRGKWNDEKCANRKFAVCYKAQCNETICGRGRCQETIKNITCLCDPGYKGDMCQTEEESANGDEVTNYHTTSQATSSSTAGFSTPPHYLTTSSETQPESAVECPPLPQPDNGYHSCLGGNLTFNSTCQFKCYSGFRVVGSPAVTCGVTGVWSGPRPVCASYKQALFAVAGCGALSALSCICFCWMKRRRRKKLAQVRQSEEVTSPFSEGQG
ncbi:P-selectin-like isoform X1 [Epinephelus moara]|uniref:P-selectin-like isoform X1 n=1 Tax=Epinephelus moara TaxID=300413 RepID=UPI00214ED3DB|nr:P-selectin-like isoform X1 [Epinephelus moara]